MTASPDVDDALFWDLADPIMASGRAEEGELMRSRCLRVDGDFLAMPEYRTGDLVVKLPADRVAELIEQDLGLAFTRRRRCSRNGCRCPGATKRCGRRCLARRSPSSADRLHHNRQNLRPSIDGRVSRVDGARQKGE